MISIDTAFNSTSVTTLNAVMTVVRQIAHARRMQETMTLRGRDTTYCAPLRIGARLNILIGHVRRRRCRRRRAVTRLIICDSARD